MFPVINWLTIQSPVQCVWCPLENWEDYSNTLITTTTHTHNPDCIRNLLTYQHVVFVLLPRLEFYISSDVSFFRFIILVNFTNRFILAQLTEGASYWDKHSMSSNGPGTTRKKTQIIQYRTTFCEVAVWPTTPQWHPLFWHVINFTSWILTAGIDCECDYMICINMCLTIDSFSGLGLDIIPIFNPSYK